MSRSRSLGLKIAAVAYTNLASNLLKGGKTIHYLFKLPLNSDDEHLNPAIREGTNHANYLRSLQVLVLDEVSMLKFKQLDAINRLLMNLKHGTTFPNNALPFGDKVVILCADFRQTLPVEKRASREITVYNILKNSQLWKQVTQIRHYKD